MADLLSSTSRIEIPFVTITLGTYTFGVKMSNDKDKTGTYKTSFPDYVKSLSIQKINGQVNTYKLIIAYPINDKTDPNFFEKLFSNISTTKEVTDKNGKRSTVTTRKILFSYGDLAMPSYIYKEEEAIIKTITKDVNVKNSIITYTINAISSCALATSGTSTWPGYKKKKPSDLIKDLLYSADYHEYGLLELFYGMRNQGEFSKFVQGNDIEVTLETKTNISVFEYLKYLVKCMQTKDGKFFSLVICDDSNNNTNKEDFNGPYFKVKQISKSNNIDYSTAYDITIGYPTAQIIRSFNVEDNETYSLYYDWQNYLNDEDYSERLDSATGEWVKTYAKPISSGGDYYKTTPDMANWWENVTQYPIKATLSLKGLLRPAVLMESVRVRVIFFGQQYIDSGIYLITKQQDEISESGYITTLSLTRVSGISFENVVE